MSLLGLDHIHLKTEDVDYTSQWYCELFDGEVFFRGEYMGSRVYYVDIKGTTLIIFGKLSNEDILENASMISYGIDHFGFRVENIKVIIEKFRKKDIKILQEPESVRPGLITAYVEGPDKIRIELIQRD